MDFLDPKKRRAHDIRLLIGYALMSIIVVLGTIIIYNLTYGYDIDRETGEIVVNGTLYVDSKPKSARVFIDGLEQRSLTDTRMVIPEGMHQLLIQKPGFRDWERTIDLKGHDIERVLYPLLIPNDFVTSDIATYDSLPTLATQSPDRKWLVVRANKSSYRFDVYDLSSPDKPATEISIPNDVLSESDSRGLEFVEWSTNNRHVLLKRDLKENGVEFILLDREKPEESLNVNKTLGITPAVMSLRNKRSDQFYFLEALPGTLRIADTKARTISAPLLNDVADYKTYGDDVILYVSKDKSTGDKMQFSIMEGQKKYKLRGDVSSSDNYVMDVSKYDNQWYYVAGSSSDGRVYIYKNPLDALRSKGSESAKAKAVVIMDNPRFVSFSANTQFISIQSGPNIITYDLEKSYQYKYALEEDVDLNQKLEWMDGHRFLFSVEGQSYIVDFDGSNEQTLVTSLVGQRPFFDRDYDNVFTFEGSKSKPGKQALTMTVVDPR